ncbi:MAG: hypothetical protein WAL97_09950 [Halobacteriota archaeon]
MGAHGRAVSIGALRRRRCTASADPIAVPELVIPDVPYQPALLFAEHPVVVAELIVLDVDFAQLVHCVYVVAEQLVGAQVLHVLAAEHPDEDVVVLAEHPDEDVVVDDVVAALAGQPCDTEVLAVVAIGVAVAVTVVEFEDVCANTPATLTIDIATAAATKKCAIFFMTILPFFLGGSHRKKPP